MGGLAEESAAAQPPDLALDMSLGVDAVSVAPLLLNPTDGFTMHILVSDFRGDLLLRGRIAGVLEFQRSLVTPAERLGRTVSVAADVAGITAGAALSQADQGEGFARGPGEWTMMTDPDIT